MALLIQPKAAKAAKGMPREDWDRLRKRLERIAGEPRGNHPDVEPLKGGGYRVRQGDWRAIYDITDGDVVVVQVGNKAKGTVPWPLTIEEAERLIGGENPVKLWREKQGWTQRALAGAAGISPSLLAEIEGGTKTGSVETLRKLAHALKVDLDALVL